MSHTLVLSVSDDAYAELVRFSREKLQTPELVAAKMLNDLLPDPLLKLSGAVKSPIGDVAPHHDEYIGEGTLFSHTR